MHTRATTHRIISLGKGHHDAVEFATGEIWLVNDLSIGQRATVLQLPVSLAEARPEEVQTGVDEGISGGLNRFARV